MPASEAKFTRRTFVGTSAAACVLGVSGGMSAASTPLAFSAATSVNQDSPRMLKSLKIGMVKVDGSLTDKFNAAKAAGFDGIEMNSPGMSVKDTNQAIAATGLPVDGTVCSTHWIIRHTSPDPAQRDQALQDLHTAIRDTHAVGGNTALLVVGHGQDGPEEEIWPRAIENIAKAIPLAAQLGVVIAIENVWNHFLYDHDGDEHQTADKFAQFVDELNSPWVGMQYDIGNHWKYGDCGQWIRTLGKRIVKLDVKGYSRAKQDWAKLGEDDINWADVREALNEINFHGWAAAEVTGGGPDRLAEISADMNDCLGLK
ncbi:MAG: sugar phosphate isomerase/epimerase family protein [Pirellulaceae bacterium]